MGSSARISSGSRRSARAIETRCCSPPESSDGRCADPVGQADQAEQLARARAHPVAGLAGDQRRQKHVLLRGQRRQEVEELKDEADPVAADAGEPGVVEAVVALAAQADLPGRWRLERAQEVEHRALAGAGRAHDRDDLGPCGPRAMRRRARGRQSSPRRRPSRDPWPRARQAPAAWAALTVRAPAGRRSAQGQSAPRRRGRSRRERRL